MLLLMCLDAEKSYTSNPRSCIPGSLYATSTEARASVKIFAAYMYLHFSPYTFSDIFNREKVS